MVQWYDLSHTYGSGMPVPDWPGERNQDFSLTSFQVESTGGFQDFLSINLHSGTHVDAPGHYAKGRASIDVVPFARLMGRCVVADLTRGPLAQIRVSDLEPLEERIRATRKLIIRTGWDEKWSTSDYVWQYPYLADEVGPYLVGLGLEVLGLDTVGPDPSLRSGLRRGSPLHNELLANDVLIIENLADLRQVAGREVFLYAFPLKIEGAFGGPARVIARDLTEADG